MKALNPKPIGPVDFLNYLYNASIEERESIFEMIRSLNSGYEVYIFITKWVDLYPKEVRRKYWELLYYYNKPKCPDITLELYMHYADRIPNMSYSLPVKEDKNATVKSRLASIFKRRNKPAGKPSCLA